MQRCAREEGKHRFNVFVDCLITGHAHDKVAEVNDRRVALLEGPLAVGNKLTSIGTNPLVAGESSGGILETIRFHHKPPSVFGAIFAALPFFEAELGEEIRLLGRNWLRVLTHEVP